MSVAGLPESFTAVDWAAVDATRHPGETGVAWWRTVQAGEVRLRRVRYTPGYRADHWCARGHVLFVLSGALTSELRDGTVVELVSGHSYHVADDASEHRSSTVIGAELLIID